MKNANNNVSTLADHPITQKDFCDFDQNFKILTTIENGGKRRLNVTVELFKEKHRHLNHI